MRIRVMCSLILAMVLVFTIQSANALTITTRAEGGGTFDSNSSTDSLSTSVAPGIMGIGEALGEPLGPNSHGQVSALEMYGFGLPGNYHAETMFEEHYENSSGGTQSYSLGYNLDGIELGFASLVSNIYEAGLADTPGSIAIAAYSVEVLLDGTSIWNSSAEIRVGGAIPSDTYTFIQSGDVQPLFNPDILPEGGKFLSNPISGDIALGELSVGDSFDLTITVGAWTHGEDLYNPLLGDMGEAYVLVGAGPNSGPEAGFLGLVSSRPVTDGEIPEPSSLVLLGFGVAALFRGLRTRDRF